MPQRLLEGSDSLNAIPRILSQWGAARPMLVTGKRFASFIPQQYAPGIQCVVFSGYHSNPDDRDAFEGARLFAQNGCDCLISLGGGSAMDTAKCIKACMLAGIGSDPFSAPFSGIFLPHLAIPATAGTGSEANGFAVIYRNGVKHSLSDERLIPEAVILAPCLLDSLPPYHKRSCAMDALCQGIESYWAKSAARESREIAALAVTGVLRHLKSYLSGDTQAAAGMLRAAYDSGRAIHLTRTTAPHAMSYKLTASLGIAHGHAVALTIPYVWEQMLGEPAMIQTLRELSALMGLADPGEGPGFLRDLLEKLELSIPPAPPPEAIQEFAACVDLDRLQNHPVPLCREQISAIYQKAFTPLRSGSCPVAGTYGGERK